MPATPGPLRVLHISHACALRTNRAILGTLQETGEVDLHLLTALRVRLAADSWQECEAPLAEAGYGFSALPILSQHIRMHVYRGLGDLVRRFRPQVIHLDYEAGSATAMQAGWAAARITERPPLMVTSYENILRDFAVEAGRALRLGRPDRAAQLLLLDRMEKRMMGRVAGLAALSPEAVEIYRRKGFRGTSRIVPLGINTDSFRPLDSSGLRHELGLRGFVIGYVGRLIREKGLDLLIHAASCLHGEYMLLVDTFEQYPNPVYRQELQDLAKAMRVAGRIVFFDARHEEMPRYINCLDCLVLPSRSTPTWKEQYGRAMIEAMACGVPVVGSNSGNIPHVLGQGDGLVFPENNVEALAAALRRLQEDSVLRRDLSLRGREKAIRDYSCSTQCRMLLEMYREIAARGQAC